MEKTYQPQVIELGNKMINLLQEDDFFNENQITDVEPARIILYDSLTEKFIQGEISDGCSAYSEEEFFNVMRLMISSCVLNSLKKKGLIDSYEDDNTEEVFFLTKDGKDFGERMKK